MSKVLITGGSGFIGTNLVQNLINAGDQVLNIDKAQPLNPAHKPYWKQVDILDYNSLEAAVVAFDPEVILHLAAVTDLNGTDFAYYRVNTDGPEHLISIAAKLRNLKRVFFTSSMYVCRPGFIPPDYDTYDPHTVYGESKVKGELLVKAIQNPSYEWVILRPTSIWGPWFNAPYIDFFNVVYQKKYFDFGKACTKTYGFVGNTVHQIRKLMDSDGVHGKTYYLGDLPAVQISEWANEISLEMGKGPIRSVPFSALKAAALCGDALARVKIKFPITSFRLSNMTTNNVLPLENTYRVSGDAPYTRLQGVRSTLAWMQEHRGYRLGA